MISESTIYWITRCDAINAGLGLLAGACGFVIVVCVFLAAENLDDEDFVKKMLRLAGISGALLLFFVVGLIFVPTTKEMALIKVVPALARSELVRETIPAEARDIYRIAKEAMVEKIKGKGEK